MTRKMDFKVSHKRLFEVGAFQCNKSHSIEALCFGHFYLREGVEARSVLEIFRERPVGNSFEDSKPGLIVVMMNPGSSKPCDPDQKKSEWKTGEGKILVPTCPDPTQVQIEKTMDWMGVRHARILNLSDICCGDSKSFYSEHRRKSPELSIFHASRREELILNLGGFDTPILLGWGVHLALKELSRQAVSVLSGRMVYGKPKGEVDFKFYHPHQRGTSRRQDWFDKVRSRKPWKLKFQKD